jgi:hypothetical protein
MTAGVSWVLQAASVLPCVASRHFAWFVFSEELIYPVFTFLYCSHLKLATLGPFRKACVRYRMQIKTQTALYSSALCCSTISSDFNGVLSSFVSFSFKKTPAFVTRFFRKTKQAQVPKGLPCGNS